MTSNGEEELQAELEGLNACYWVEVFTENTISNIYFKGSDCKPGAPSTPVTYALNGKFISYAFDGKDDEPQEIIELSNTTLKFQEKFETYTDLYTY